MKKEKIRCKQCNRRLFDGSPGYDIIKNRPKKQIVKCPKCGNYNLITSAIEEKVIVRLIDKKAYEIENKIVIKI